MIDREDFDYSLDYIDAVKRRHRNLHRLAAVLILVTVAGIIVFFLTYYKVRSIQVSGSTRYTNEEISEMVTGGFLSDNSLVLSLKYRNRQMRDVPFIEQMDVTVVTHDTIRITVYEKSLAGYVEYLGSNFYFGRDGTVVESSKDVVEGVPRIIGLSFDHIALYEQLPVDDPDIFGRILNVTQLLSKYDLSADSIYYDESGNMTIYFSDVRVSMGNDDYTDEKLSNVAQILPSLDGKGAGTLRMSGYTPSTRYITYVLKNGKAADVVAGTGNAEPASASTESNTASAPDAEPEALGSAAPGDLQVNNTGTTGQNDGAADVVTQDPAPADVIATEAAPADTAPAEEEHTDQPVEEPVVEPVVEPETEPVEEHVEEPVGDPIIPAEAVEITGEGR